MHPSMDLLGRKLLSSLASAGIYCSAENANRLVSKRLHKKSRMNCCCRNSAYPLTMIQRQFVPDGLVAWERPFLDYEPVEYNLDELANDQADPTTPGVQFRFNALDGSVDRRSCMGPYFVVNGRPVNPVGRTGLSGRGALRRWGPNHRIFLLFTRLNMVEVSYNLLQGDALEFTEFLSIQDESGQWCFPSVFSDKPEFDVNIDFVQQLKLEIVQRSTPEEAEKIIQKLKKHHVQVARSYYDDARNTDNAWVEIIAYEFGQRHQIGRFDFESDNNSMHLQWRHLERSPLDHDSFR
uniref:ADP-ribose pyrophosphatase, mitochondrial n=1 Tax=Trichuris muris TaxID=70415 RepID=A0A5S6R5Z9_TRIMR